MSTICKHIFEKPSRDNSDYSQLEYDLYARLGMSIRKNLKTDEFEIYHRPSEKLQYRYSRIEDIVRIANSLEGADNTDVGCRDLKCGGE